MRGPVTDWPHPFTGPAGEQVQVFQHRPDLTDECADWCDGTVLLVNGGPAVLLDLGGVAGLGDFVVFLPGKGYFTEPADGFYVRYRPIAASEATAPKPPTD